MGKWTALFIILFYVHLFRKGVSAGEEKDFFSNILFKEPIDEAQCDRMQSEVIAMDSTTVLDDHPRLHGKWVSQECEVKPGPEFLLRSYYFSKTNSFRLLQHIYEDESCILPLYTIVAKGKLFLKRSSWVTPGASESEYVLHVVTIIPHTTEMAEKLSRDLKETCNDFKNTTWKPHRQYTIYNLNHFKNLSKSYRKRRKYGKYKTKSHRKIDCLSAVGVEFNELMLIRTQTRPFDDGLKSKELLLGDVHSRQEARFTYKPTAFQVPLLKSDHVQNCVNCQLILKGTERVPPHLLSKPQLPPLPHGQWISQRCEVRPFGMFLKRKLSFDSRDRTWLGEYKFFSDPFCREPSFAILASGRYVLGSIHSKEKLIWKKKTGTNFDFKIENASVTVYDSSLLKVFNSETMCGVGPWTLGVSKDLSSTSGCSVLGIVLPTTEYELIKLEIDSKGTPLLFMGLPDTENKRRTHKERPTSYQAPLAQCSVFPQQNMISNHLEPIFYARTAPSSSGTTALSHSSFVFKFIMVYLFLNLRVFV